MNFKAIFSSVFAVCLVACSGAEGASSQPEATDERADAVVAPPADVLVCGAETCAPKERCCNDCSGNKFCARICPQFDCGPGAQDEGASELGGRRRTPY